MSSRPEGAPTLEDLVAEGFTGEKLVLELVKRGTAKSEGQARFMVDWLEGGGCIPESPPPRPGS